MSTLLEEYAEQARAAVAAIKQLPDLSGPTAEGKCPKCSGAVYDNRAKPGNWPLWKCRNRACDWRVYLRHPKASTGDKLEQRPGRPRGYR